MHPTLIPARRLIANVEGVMNAILVKGDAVGATCTTAPAPARSRPPRAVIADLVDVTRMHTADPEHRVPHLAFQPDQLSNVADPADGRSRDLLLPAHARARTSRACWPTSRASSPTAAISIDAMVQKEPPRARTQVDIIMLTHLTVEKHINAAIAAIEKLPVVVGKVTRIRLEELGAN